MPNERRSFEREKPRFARASAMPAATRFNRTLSERAKRRIVGVGDSGSATSTPSPSRAPLPGERAAGAGLHGRVAILNWFGCFFATRKHRLTNRAESAGSSRSSVVALRLRKRRISRRED